MNEHAIHHERSSGCRPVAPFNRILAELEAESRLQNGQLEQTREALTIYYEQFLGIALDEGIKARRGRIILQQPRNVRRRKARLRLAVRGLESTG